MLLEQAQAIGRVRVEPVAIVEHALGHELVGGAHGVEQHDVMRGLDDRHVELHVEARFGRRIGLGVRRLHRGEDAVEDGDVGRRRALGGKGRGKTLHLAAELQIVGDGARMAADEPDHRLLEDGAENLGDVGALARSRRDEMAGLQLLQARREGSGATRRARPKAPAPPAAGRPAAARRRGRDPRSG